MSGHSKWSTIKHQKGAADARRGQLFTKLSREIIVAARQGGANPESNFRLRLAVQKARDNNMPLDTIDRAIKKGAGQLEGESLTELTFEGYGPKGVAVIVEEVTDNRNRTLQEVRSVFSRHGGNLGESGCVGWLFDEKGMITVEATGVDTEELALYAIDAGAEDVQTEKRHLEIYTQPQDMENVRRSIEEKGMTVVSADISLVPKSTVNLDEKAAAQTFRLMDKLEELDEVQKVFSNIDFSEDVLEKLQALA